ncbi:MAG: hypothetical protein IPK67_14415 [Planctomycetes bacterium]|nr:hypothetical protein [Planctomycetota bacterium]
MPSAPALTAQHPLTFFVSVAAAVFAGVAGALFFDHLLQPAQSPLQVGDPVSIAHVDPALVEAMSTLAAELRTGRVGNVGSIPPSSETQRTLATESGESILVELAAAVRELRTALRQDHGSVTLATSPATSLPYGAARKLLPDLPEGESNRSRAYTRHHLLWTEQQVLDRYGQPDMVGRTSSQDQRVRWSYCDGQDQEPGFTFVMYQGRVEQVLARW